MIGEELGLLLDKLIDVIKFIIECETFTITGKVNLMMLVFMMIATLYKLCTGKNELTYLGALAFVFLITVVSVQQASEVLLNHKISALK